MSKISQRRALLLAAIVPVVLVAGCSAGSNTQAMKGEASPATPTDTMMTPSETETGMESPTETMTGTETASPTGTATMAPATQPRAAVQNYFDALKGGNVEQVVGTFTDDAVVAMDGEATATGAQAIRTLFQKQLQDGNDLKSATHTIDETRTIGGKDAIARSTSKQGDTNYRELFVLTQEGGHWLISRFMNNQAS
ncbi:YybH family protein [Nonomuraea spiralis]|uniref:YybH family protein n=1 Tax=Nonomuraea spiralis TaxID=46182 RepID=A0ABV5IEA9_9ACTN|nr:nuclear transport factor 2 family protein [Nonomuraea spiralis]